MLWVPVRLHQHLKQQQIACQTVTLYQLRPERTHSLPLLNSLNLLSSKSSQPVMPTTTQHQVQSPQALTSSCSTRGLMLRLATAEEGDQAVSGCQSGRLQLQNVKNSCQAVSPKLPGGARLSGSQHCPHARPAGSQKLQARSWLQRAMHLMLMLLKLVIPTQLISCFSSNSKQRHCRTALMASTLTSHSRHSSRTRQSKMQHINCRWHHQSKCSSSSCPSLQCSQSCQKLLPMCCCLLVICPSQRHWYPPNCIICGYYVIKRDCSC